MGKKEFSGANRIASDFGLLQEEPTQENGGNSKVDQIAKNLGLLNAKAEQFATGTETPPSLPGYTNPDTVFNILKPVDASDSEKEHVIDMAKKGATHDEISDAILTIQGKHPKQEGGYKYYLEDTPKGYQKMVPINNTEKPPKGLEVNSIWGTQTESEDDTRTQDIAKKIYNVLPSIAGSANDLGQVVYGSVTGDELPWYQALKNSEQYLKFKTSSDYDKGIINTPNIHEFSDLLDADSYDFSPSTLANTATQVGASVLQFIATRGALGAAGKGTNTLLKAGKITKETAEKAIKMESYAKGFASSYMVNLGEAMQAANDLGVTGRDAYLTALAVTVPVAALDVIGGGEGAINKAFEQETGKSLVKNLVGGAIKDADGKITKETLDGLYKSAYTVAATVAEKTPKTLLRTAGEESAQEVGQNVLQKASQVIHDNLIEDPNAKYGTELFSPQSVAEYLNDAFGGLIGGAQGHVLSKPLKQKEQEDEKSKAIMSAVSGGNVNELKTQLHAAAKSGDITPEDLEKGLFRIDTYQKYYDATKDRPLDEDSKRKIFDLTYEKSSVNAGIEHLEKNNPDGINDGEIDLKKGQIKEIDTTIDGIWKGQEEKVKKEGEPITKAVKDFKFKAPLIEYPERKVYGEGEDLSAEEFNQSHIEDKFHYMYDKAIDWQKKGVKALHAKLEIPNDRASFVKVGEHTVELASSDQEKEVEGHAINGILRDFDNKEVRIRPEEINGFKALVIYDAEGHPIRNRLGQPYTVRQTEAGVGVSKYGHEQLIHPTNLEYKSEGIHPEGNLQTWKTGLEGEVETLEVKAHIAESIKNPNRENTYGEKYIDFAHRTIGAYKKLLDKAKDKTLLVTHSQVMKLINQWEKQGRPEDLNELDFNEIADEKYSSEEIHQYPSAKGSVVLVRHGDTNQNESVPETPNKVRTKEVELAEQGVKTAEELAHKLKPIGITDIITSPLKRARQTAIIIKNIIHGNDEGGKAKTKPSPVKPKGGGLGEETKTAKTVREEGDKKEAKQDKEVAEKYLESTEKVDKFVNNGEKETDSGETNTGTTENVGQKNIGFPKKTETKRTGVPRHRQKIKNPLYLKILDADVTESYGMALQYFIGKGLVNTESIRNLFKNPNAEVNARKLSYLSKDADGVEAISEKIHDNLQEELQAKYNNHDIRNALEEVIIGHNNVKAMAETFKAKYLEGVQESVEEKALMQIYGANEVESAKDEEFIDAVINEVEKLSDEDLKAITDNQESFDKWEDDTDIFTSNEPVDFQKPKTPKKTAKKSKEKEIDSGEKAFEKWKDKNKEYEGAEIEEVKTGEPVMLTVYHGTTNEFYEFDSSVKGNVEGHLGKINYFTSDKGDADLNYLAEGKDLTNRIEQRKERLEQELEGMDKEEIADSYDLDLKKIKKLSLANIAKLISEKELKGGEEKVLKLHIKLDNPIVLGKESTWIETIPAEAYEDYLDAAAQEIADDYGIEKEGAKADYEYEVRDRAIQNSGAENKLMEALQQAIDDNIGSGHTSASEVLQDFGYEQEVDLNALEKSIRENEQLSYAEGENGELVSSQIIADFFKNLGYDGIILTDVSERFKNMGIGSYTSHIHVFDEYANQIKLADGTNKTFSPDTKDIRYQKEKDQKRSQAFEQSKLDAVKKITTLLQSRNHKLKIVYDNKLKAAGAAQGNAIKINPFYAGTDTPIHEVAHILIDSIGGLDNKVIRSAVNELKGTKLWQETEAHYPELSEDGLAKEVLAEAIGRDGANIFDAEAQKSKFKTLLDYIFHRIKSLFGIERNNVKALAKRVIAGDVYNKSKKTFESQNQKPNNKNIKVDKNNKKSVIFDVANEGKEQKQEYKTQEGETIPFTSLASEQGEFDFSGEPNVQREGNNEPPYDSGLANPNDICWMERTMSEQKHISLTGPSKIKSSADIAYLFRHLEDASSENAFAVLMKDDGSYNVLYLGTGSTVGVIIDAKFIYAAAKEFDATKVSFVHNHPTGNLNPSDADYSVQRKMKALFEMAKIKVLPGVIINLDSGQFTEFAQNAFSSTTRPTEVKGEKKAKVLSFDKQVLHRPSSERTKITGSQGIAEFLSKQKRGSVPKLGIIVLDRRNNITRYVMEDETLGEAELTDRILTNIGKSGESVILVTNDKFDKDTLKRISIALKDNQLAILDAIEVTDEQSILSGNYSSYADQGIALEKEEKYEGKKPVSEGKEYFKKGKALPINFIAKKHFGTSIKELDVRKKELADKIKSASNEDKASLEIDLKNLNDFRKTIEDAYKEYQQNIDGIKGILANEEDFDSIPESELLRMYNYIVQYDDTMKSGYFKDILYRIAKSLVTKQNTLLQSKGVEVGQYKFRDLKHKDILFKSLTHIQEYFPELQQLSKYWDKAYESYVSERETNGAELTDLAKSVIKEEKNKEGVSIANIFSPNTPKYFKWMDDNGELLTVAKAKIQGLSEAKISYLEKYREIKDAFAPEQTKATQTYEENGLIKTDRNFREIYGQDGLIPAIQSWLSPNSKTGEIKLYYDHKLVTLNDINLNLQRKSQRGVLSKVMAATKSLYYSVKAQKLLAKKTNEDGSKLPESFYRTYTINQSGQIVNRFGHPFGEDKKYSTDFHGAMMSYINDMSFAKNVTPILPYINAVEYYNATKIGDKEVKPNVTKFIELWKAKHILREQKTLFPEIDIPMRFLRNMTSMIAMTFNLKAGFWNNAIGNYSSWRELGGKKYLTGQKRFFKLSNKTGKYFVSKKARAIINKYNIVQSESTTDLKPFVGKMFAGMSTIFTKLGEFQVQGSLFLGQISKEDYTKIDENGEYQGVDKEKFEERMSAYRKKVSDINGKYSDKDRRNFESWELGRFMGQFRSWTFDWAKERFGEKYYTADGQEHYGAYRAFTQRSFKELKENVMNGKMFTSDEYVYKRMRENLRGAMVTAVLLSLSLSADDDDKKRQKGDALSQATQNLLFVFDPSTLQYMLKTPAAGLKSANDFFNAFQSAFNAKESKGKNKFLRVLPYKNLIDNEYVQEEK